ncbi:LYSC protein, partial [Thalassarche chlororhynchos]|nr:LYSC protein [Thalassarche chlororhynchos]
IRSWLIVAFCLLPLAAQGKVYERCELAAAMKHLGPNNFWGHSLGLCKSALMASGGTWESRILQTNSWWWCNGGRTPRAKHVCNIPCSALLSSDRTPSLTCAQRAASDGNGPGA